LGWGYSIFFFIIAGFSGDLFLALRAYKGMDNLRGRDAHLSWFLQRLRFILATGVLYVLFVGIIFSDLRITGITYENKEHFDAARVYSGHGKDREDVSELRNALEKNPDDRAVRLVLARALLTHKDFSGAEKEFRFLAKLDSVSSDYRYGLAQVMLATGRKSSGQIELREAIRLQPLAVEPHLLLAREYQAEEKNLLAVEECRLALGLQQDNRPVRELLVTAALAGRLYDMAATQAQVGRKNDATDIKMWLYEAQARIGLGQSAEVERVLREAAAANPLVAEPWLVLADFFAERKAIHGAMLCYDEGLMRDPQNLSAMNNFARMLADQDIDLWRAQELAAYLCWKQPRNPAYADTLGWVLVKLNRPEQAITLLRIAVNRTPNLPNTHYHLGVALIKSGDKIAGRGELAKALKLSMTFDGAAQAKELLGNS
jgi:predicted Zn-dependent protease